MPWFFLRVPLPLIGVPPFCTTPWRTSHLTDSFFPSQRQCPPTGPLLCRSCPANARASTRVAAHAHAETHEQRWCDHCQRDALSQIVVYVLRCSRARIGRTILYLFLFRNFVHGMCRLSFNVTPYPSDSLVLRFVLFSRCLRKYLVTRSTFPRSKRPWKISEMLYVS
jgi:hypothetical protein